MCILAVPTAWYPKLFQSTHMLEFQVCIIFFICSNISEVVSGGLVLEASPKYYLLYDFDKDTYVSLCCLLPPITKH